MGLYSQHTSSIHAGVKKFRAAHGAVHGRGSQARLTGGVHGGSGPCPDISGRVRAVSRRVNKYRRPYLLSKDTQRKAIRQLACLTRIVRVSEAYRCRIRVGHGYDGFIGVSE